MKYSTRIPNGNRPPGPPRDARRGDELEEHVARLRGCQRCPAMLKPVVSGGPVWSEVMLVGQAPGAKEPLLGRPFAWTAGKTLFRWFEDSCDLNEEQFRKRVYMAAVCRCFPGKKEQGGDRVPSRVEVAHCASWLREELRILKPRLVLAVGKLAIQQFLPEAPLEQVVGRSFRIRHKFATFDLVPLPHPSGASPWPRVEPGKTLLAQALCLVKRHEAIQRIVRAARSDL